MLLAWAALARAQISVDGVEDKEVYRDRVSFTVHSENSFEYAARLNDEPVATDVPIEVDEPEYYELSVERREPSADTVENLLIQFKKELFPAPLGPIREVICPAFISILTSERACTPPKLRVIPSVRNKISSFSITTQLPSSSLFSTEKRDFKGTIT